LVFILCSIGREISTCVHIVFYCLSWVVLTMDVEVHNMYIRLKLHLLCAFQPTYSTSLKILPSIQVNCTFKHCSPLNSLIMRFDIRSSFIHTPCQFISSSWIWICLFPLSIIYLCYQTASPHSTMLPSCLHRTTE
jgi:hypothetical protein